MLKSRKQKFKMYKLFSKIKKFLYKYIFNYLKYEFTEFIPNSESKEHQKNELIKTNIKSYTSSMLNISQWFYKQEVTYLSNLNVDKNVTTSLHDMFENHGSDKNKHGYDILYSYVFSKISNNPTILEIGIGTNNKQIASNMGKYGKPGASLRAFSQYFATSEIYGADIDKNILFNFKNIKTFYLNQNDIDTFDNKLIENKKFDLIIDDGLHMQSANLNTFRFSLDRLNEKGALVIEDIPLSALDTWKIVATLLAKPFDLEIVQCIDNFAVILNKN